MFTSRSIRKPSKFIDWPSLGLNIGNLIFVLDMLPATAKQTITQKMADQGRSDLDEVFTMILCATNF